MKNILLYLNNSTDFKLITFCYSIILELYTNQYYKDILEQDFIGIAYQLRYYRMVRFEYCTGAMIFQHHEDRI
jgi:hypothetical protein